MISINGEKCERCNRLIELLDGRGYRNDRIAVEINGEIVKKSDYEKKVINDGDVIEVVSFVGGG